MHNAEIVRRVAAAQPLAGKSSSLRTNTSRQVRTNS